MGGDAPEQPRVPDLSARLSAIYQELILDHYRRPRNKGEMEAPDARATRKNPLCGDVIELTLAWDGDRVREVKFTGRGCSISQASASMMTEAVQGKTVKDALGLTETIRLMMHGEAPADDLGDLMALEGVAKFPVRVKCALLAWMALKDALTQNGDGAHA